MMKEVNAQKLMIDAVSRIRKGKAFKLSSRYLIGVSDLFVKIPNYPGAFVEVKMNEKPKTKETVTLGVTPLQAKFMKEFSAAGQPCMVASFLCDDKNELFLSCRTYDDIAHGDEYYKPWELPTYGYFKVTRGLREKAIVDRLEACLDEFRNDVKRTWV